MDAGPQLDTKGRPALKVNLCYNWFGLFERHHFAHVSRRQRTGISEVTKYNFPYWMVYKKAEDNKEHFLLHIASLYLRNATGERARFYWSTKCCCTRCKDSPVPKMGPCNAIQWRLEIVMPPPPPQSYYCFLLPPLERIYSSLHSFHMLTAMRGVWCLMWCIVVLYPFKIYRPVAFYAF
jgi:hypothetical protein